jgi:hypothetical protein
MDQDTFGQGSSKNNISGFKGLTVGQLTKDYSNYIIMLVVKPRTDQ